MEPADRELLSQETREAIAAHRRGELEYRIHTASGELRWIWDRFHIVRDMDDAPIALEGLMLDVTDRHLARKSSWRISPGAGASRTDSHRLPHAATRQDVCRRPRPRA